MAAAQIPISRGTPIVPESEGADTSRLLGSISAPVLLLSGSSSPIASAQQQTRYQTAASRSSPANHRVSAFALAVRARRLGFLAVAALRAPALDVIARSF